jgi:hypothetical protein
VVDTKSRIVVPVRDGGVKGIDIEYVEELLALHNEELTTEELSNFKFIDPLCLKVGTADGGTVVKVLCYKSEGRWFDSRWCHWNFPLI